MPNIFISPSFLKDVFTPLSSRLHCFSQKNLRCSLLLFLCICSVFFFLRFPYRLSLCHWCRTAWFSCSSWSSSSCFLCFGFIGSPIGGFIVSHKSWKFTAINFFKIVLFSAISSSSVTTIKCILILCWHCPKAHGFFSHFFKFVSLSLYFFWDHFYWCCRANQSFLLQCLIYHRPHWVYLRHWWMSKYNTSRNFIWAFF